MTTPIYIDMAPFSGRAFDSRKWVEISLPAPAVTSIWLTELVKTVAHHFRFFDVAVTLERPADLSPGKALHLVLASDMEWAGGRAGVGTPGQWKAQEGGNRCFISADPANLADGTVAVHELAHCLGLSHQIEADGSNARGEPEGLGPIMGALWDGVAEFVWSYGIWALQEGGLFQDDVAKIGQELGFKPCEFTDHRRRKRVIHYGGGHWNDGASTLADAAPGLERVIVEISLAAGTQPATVGMQSVDDSGVKTALELLTDNHERIGLEPGERMVFPLNLHGYARVRTGDRINGTVEGEGLAGFRVGYVDVKPGEVLVR